MVSVLRERLLTSVTAVPPPASSPGSFRTDFVSELTGDASHPETPYETDHDSAFPNGCRYHKSQRKRMCTLPGVLPEKSSMPSTTILQVAYAQVKSCVLLAGMYSDGITRVTEPVLCKSRGDHAELLWRQCNRRGNNSIHQTGPISLRT